MSGRVTTTAAAPPYHTCRSRLDCPTWVGASDCIAQVHLPPAHTQTQTHPHPTTTITTTTIGQARLVAAASVAVKPAKGEDLTCVAQVRVGVRERQDTVRPTT